MLADLIVEFSYANFNSLEKFMNLPAAGLKEDVVLGCDIPDFDESLLDLKLVTEKFGLCNGGKWQLVRIPGIEGRESAVKRASVNPNPGQPRKYFAEGPLAELQASIAEGGQLQAIKLVPVLEIATNRVILVILDGERRFRAMTKLEFAAVKATTTYVKTEDELFEDSMLANEGSEPHNAIERAQGYKRMLDRRMASGMKKGEAMRAISKRMSVSVGKIEAHLALLDLPSEAQDLIITHAVPTATVLQIIRKSRVGDLSLLKRTRAMLDALEERGGDANTKKGARGRLNEVMRSAVLEGTLDPAVESLQREVLLDKVSGLAVALRGKVQAVLDMDPDTLKALLRSRKQIPEVVEGVLGELEDLVEQYRETVRVAIAPDPLPVAKGKPKMRVFVGTLSPNCFDNNKDRIAIINSIAALTDQGDVVTVAELSANLGNLPIQTVVSNIQRIKVDMRICGVRLDISSKRELDGSKTWVKKDAHRFAWFGIVDDEGNFSPHESFKAHVSRALHGGIHERLRGQEVTVLTTAHKRYLDLAKEHNLAGNEALVRIGEDRNVKKLPRGILELGL